MTVGAMVAAGFRALGRWKRLALGLYLAELSVGVIFAVVAWRVLGIVYGRRPLFDRAVDGDAVAMLLAIKAEPGVWLGLVGGGVGLVLGWALLSFYLTPGLLGVFAGRPFGEAARRGFWPFVRLWAWSIVPMALALAIAVLGAHLTGGGDEDALVDRWRLVGAHAGALPGLLLLMVLLCAVDYARADIVVRRPGAGRALLRGLRLVLTRPAPLVHYALYLVAVAAVAAVYMTAAAPLGWLLLLVVRPLVLALRFAARLIASAGQVELVTARDSRSA